MRLPLRSFAALALLTGCLHGGATPTAADRAPTLVIDEPLLITVSDPDEARLAALNDEELFTLGSSRFAAEDWEGAARAFARLCDVFPHSEHFGAATYNAGLALERLARWQDAWDRYVPLLDLEHGSKDQIDAGFRAAECAYHLEKYEQAIALLQRIRTRMDLSLDTRLAALVQIGICQVEDGQLEAGEKSLREAVRTFEHADDSERLDDYFPAQAQFFLGEVYRAWFDQVVLDPNLPGGTDRLGKDLELKASMLLSAQGHYLRAMRIGNAQWATAAGQRVGSLYETLHEAMLSAPSPNELDAEAAQVYREELQKKVKVLVTKSIAIYERTLEAAERTGTSGPFIEQARASLERMKKTLLETARIEEETAPPAKVAPAPPPAPAKGKRAGPATAPRSARVLPQPARLATR